MARMVGRRGGVGRGRDDGAVGEQLARADQEIAGQRHGELAVLDPRIEDALAARHQDHGDARRPRLAGEDVRNGFPGRGAGAADQFVDGMARQGDDEQREKRREREAAAAAVTPIRQHKK